MTSGELTRRIHDGRLVKICGLREPEHAAAAASAGADLIGFILAPSRRQITPEQARACIDAARREARQTILAVGIVVDSTAPEVIDAIARSGVDLIQLHGSEPSEFPSLLPVPTLRAFSPVPAATLATEHDRITAALDVDVPPVAIVVDGYHPGGSGGAGVRADWALASALAKNFPLILAGGLDPSNVADAIRTVRPLGVDVSSGVEVDGVKSVDRIAEFVANARAAFAD